jgi:hypothetical protein
VDRRAGGSSTAPTRALVPSPAMRGRTGGVAEGGADWRRRRGWWEEEGDVVGPVGVGGYKKCECRP